MDMTILADLNNMRSIQMWHRERKWGHVRMWVALTGSTHTVTSFNLWAGHIDERQ